MFQHFQREFLVATMVTNRPLGLWFISELVYSQAFYLLTAYFCFHPSLSRLPICLPAVMVVGSVSEYMSGAAYNLRRGVRVLQSAKSRTDSKEVQKITFVGGHMHMNGPKPMAPRHWLGAIGWGRAKSHAIRVRSWTQNRLRGRAASLFSRSFFETILTASVKMWTWLVGIFLRYIYFL